MITKNLLFVFGTRPEAIKMAPLIKVCSKEPLFNVKICVTAQHREMLDQVLNTFSIVPDYDLNSMQEKQDLSTLSALLLTQLKEVFQKESPDLVIVQGDTTSALMAALSAFYHKIPVAHIEAGLRTNNAYNPFPEELNRQLITRLATYHFAPTEQNKENLLKENIPSENIFVTGNTGIDSLKQVLQMEFHSDNLSWAEGQPLLILTTHRKENIGKNMQHIFEAVLRIAKDFPQVRIIYPMHKNPLARDLALKMLSNQAQIRLTEPLDPIEFQHLLAKSYLVLTDSGGIQEEATQLGRPLLVLREITERLEGIGTGNLKIVGTNTESIYNATKELLTDSSLYQKMCTKNAVYDGQNASQLIVNTLKQIL